MCLDTCIGVHIGTPIMPAPHTGGKLVKTVKQEYRQAYRCALGMPSAVPMCTTHVHAARHLRLCVWPSFCTRIGAYTSRELYVPYMAYRACLYTSTAHVYTRAYTHVQNTRLYGRLCSCLCTHLYASLYTCPSTMIYRDATGDAGMLSRSACGRPS